MSASAEAPPGARTDGPLGDAPEISGEPAPAATSESNREAFRARATSQIPASYMPLVHLLAPAGFAAAVFVGCAALVRDLHAIELVTIPVTLLSGFAFEWRIHKSVLHRRLPVPGLSALYVRHELHHHVIYTYDDMTMRSRREWRFVLMPVYAIPVVFGMLVPLGLGVWRLLGSNVALLFVATSMIFFVTYEWLHLAYHLPLDHPVSKLGPIQRLRELHSRHHDPKLMKRWNFNVTVPLFDWIYGTIWSPDRERLRREKRAARAR